MEREIAISLGVAPSVVTRPRVTSRVYACRYRYRDGAIALSVRRFPDTDAAARYAAGLRRRRGQRPEPPELGDGLEAFMTNDGSVVVRKAREVLDVDVAALPQDFGEPPQPTNVVALAVATTIVGHWSPG